MFLFFEPSLVQEKVLEGIQGLRDAFNENETLVLQNSEILESKKENKNLDLSNSSFRVT